MKFIFCVVVDSSLLLLLLLLSSRELNNLQAMHLIVLAVVVAVVVVAAVVVAVVLLCCRRFVVAVAVAAVDVSTWKQTPQSDYCEMLPQCNQHKVLVYLLSCLNKGCAIPTRVPVEEYAINAVTLETP